MKIINQIINKCHSGKYMQPESSKLRILTHQKIVQKIRLLSGLLDGLHTDVITPDLRKDSITKIVNKRGFKTKKSAFADFGGSTKVRSNLAYHLYKIILNISKEKKRPPFGKPLFVGSLIPQVR